MEDHVYLLDYLHYGKHERRNIKRQPIAYGLGEKEFKILELIPKPDVMLKIGDKVYIGKDLEKRKEILHVKRRVKYEELTSTAQSELPYVIKEIVSIRETDFVSFYNSAGAISRKYHGLQLLPGIGQKTMWAIINARKIKNFESFEDIEKKVGSLFNPLKSITDRIEQELKQSDQKYFLFVAK
ncbi:MAG: DUF655 domain-containing protein [Candidatus Thermoplasmatota archaeon]|nr:DUF655 domain-containing protein [Candidatus Thermoplasmatota archaeon]